jgi:hypothetical protein
MTADVISLSTYRCAATNAVPENANVNEENFLAYMLWDLAQSSSEISALSDSVGRFFDNNPAQIYDLTKYKKKSA